MKKDELVHLHSLLSLVETELSGRGVVASADLRAYEDLDVSPMAVYGSKADHEAAVMALARGLGDACEGPAGDDAGGVAVTSD